MTKLFSDVFYARRFKKHAIEMNHKFVIVAGISGNLATNTHRDTNCHHYFGIFIKLNADQVIEIPGANSA
ncbi:hypothetical protein AFK66_021470 [Cronobacter malonaticus LMG 23826]|nr:hypothetical protein AFK66_021470 [Cronobacter malonaticus LMG 23826]